MSQERVRNILRAAGCDQDDVDGDWDSLFQLKAVLIIEEAFGCEFTTSEIQTFKSCKAVGEWLSNANY